MTDYAFSRAASPEKELLLLCARKDPAPRAAQRVRELSRQPLNWQLVATSAWDHRVSQLLTSNLERLCAENVPEIWMQYLRENRERNLRRSLMLGAELLRVMDLLQSAGIQAIPYKGPTLAALAYGDLGMREFGDLDLLVAHDEIERAQQIMQGLDYQTQPRTPGGQTPQQQVPGQYIFFRDQDRYLVELHTERTLRYFPKPLNIALLRGRLQPAPIGGRTVPTLGMEDLLNFLCVHGSKHFWNRIQWISDIAELVDGGRAPNLSAALDRANEFGSRRMLLLGLRLADELLGACIPENIRGEHRAEPSVDFMAAQVREIIFTDHMIEPAIGQRTRFRMHMRGGLISGLLYSLRLATVPTEEDWRGAPLPRPLAPIYALLRPLRLIGKYGMGLRPRGSPDLGPFVATAPEIVEAMLNLAALRENDVLYDLGCGDGQIVAAAAARFGCRCLGIDVDLQRISEAHAKVEAAGLEHLIRLVCDDVRNVDLSPATVVTMYLTIPGNAKLRQQLTTTLRPGTRVVSRDWDMPGWRAERTVEMKIGEGMHATLFLWRIGSESGEHADATAREAEKLLR